MRILIVGPAHPLRGGLATFNQRLAQQFTSEGHHCSLISFSLQYPGFLFPGTTQYSTDPAPEGIEIHTLINSINPLNWMIVGNKLKKWKPDLVVVRFWLPLMGPALGTLLRRIKSNGHTRVVCIADNVIPHEKRPGDTPFTRYFLKSCDAFVTMSEKVLQDLRQFEKEKPAKLVQHPLYDNFGAPVSKEAARAHLGLAPSERILLFFGFIRAYKGLDLLLRAMATPLLRNSGIKLLIAGEYYEEEKPYTDLIADLGLAEQVVLRTQFIPDSEVRYYLCAGDCVVQPYRNATQSGVTPLAYHFDKPMIVTNVGGLPALVPHERSGLVSEPDPESLAQAIIRFYQLGEDFFIPHLRAEKQKYAWSNLTKALIELAH
ncbi:MAG TPA: glycosyltransferase [Flavisolibacter sp.]|jgi:glycosyltransferase involved in cell wall biosynthesis|nr:glycosyltransferase [Flavisolibacter sp.]